MRFDVYGIGNPLMDFTYFVEEPDLAALGLRKGSMNLIDEKKRQEIFRHFSGRKTDTYPAGDCPNTIRGVASLGGRAAFSGKVGDDPEGSRYIESLQKEGVITQIAQAHGLTGTSTILVTPDKERTMATFLGNCRLFSAGDINLDILRDSRYLYITGYMWDTESQMEAAKVAFMNAKASGVNSIFNLADVFVCTKNCDEFYRIIKEYVSIVVANEREAATLSKRKEAEEAVKFLSTLCSTVVVTMGEKGSLIYKDGKRYLIQAYRTDAVDTTGGGDMYAAGLVYGLSQGKPIEEAAKVGSYLASKIVAQIGTRISKEIITDIKKQFF